MQTFLPYPSYAQSASVLDRQRLGKQRVEAYQILRAIRGETKGWVNHPATKMWVGYERELIQYTTVMCYEWISRGYKDSILEKVTAILDQQRGMFGHYLPHWFGDPKLHLSHQSNLVRKMPEHYGELFDVEPDLPYYWPEGRK